MKYVSCECPATGGTQPNLNNEKAQTTASWKTRWLIDDHLNDIGRLHMLVVQGVVGHR